MIFDKIKELFTGKIEEPRRREYVALHDPFAWRHPRLFDDMDERTAMNLSVVSACVEIRSDSIGKMPFFVKDTANNQVELDHPISRLLKVRPNPLMTPYTFKKLIETWRLLRGNAYVYIARKSRSGEATDLIPISPNLMEPFINTEGELWYSFNDGQNQRLIEKDSIIHLKGYTEDGILGTSVLSRAAMKIRTMNEQAGYEQNFYRNNAQPSGILTVESDVKAEAKQKVREEWQKIYGGTDNAFKVAILDNGLQYQPISVSNRDAQFIESAEASIADIARFFLVPLYKLQAGKQTYQSNEQNAIEYVTTAIAPTVKQYEEEFTYKALFPKEIKNNVEIVANMNAEMRGDTATRSQWYKYMRDVGAYSVNDIRRYEDLPNVDGGDSRIAPLNSIPLSKFDEYFQGIMENRQIANQGGFAEQTNQTGEEAGEEAGGDEE